MAKSLTFTMLSHGKMAEEGFKRRGLKLKTSARRFQVWLKIALRPFELIWCGSVDKPNKFVNRLSYLSDDFIIISVRQLLIVTVNCLATKETPTKTELSPLQMFPPIVNMQSPTQNTSSHS